MSEKSHAIILHETYEKNSKVKASDFRKVGFSEQELSCKKKKKKLEFRKSRSYLREQY